MAEYSFYFWTALLIPSRDEKVISEFVKLGYTVESLSGTPTIRSEGAPVGLLALHLRKKSDKKIDEDSVRKDFKNLVTEHKISYYNMIVTAPASSAWCLGNINLKDFDSKTVAVLKIGSETNKD